MSDVRDNFATPKVTAYGARDGERHIPSGPVVQSGSTLATPPPSGDALEKTKNPKSAGNGVFDGSLG